MKLNKQSILNLVVILGLLLLLLPQQSTVAQTGADGSDSRGDTITSNPALAQPYSGPAKDLDKNTSSASQSASVTIAGWHFKPYFSECMDKFSGDEGYGKLGPKETLTEACYVTYPLVLPAGAKLERIYFNYYDASDLDLTLKLRKYDDVGTDGVVENIVDISSSGNEGYNYAVSDAIDHVIEKYYSYNINIIFPAGADATLLFSSVDIDYSLPGMFGMALPMIQRP